MNGNQPSTMAQNESFSLGDYLNLSQNFVSLPSIMRAGLLSNQYLTPSVAAISNELSRVRMEIAKLYQQVQKIITVDAFKHKPIRILFGVDYAKIPKPPAISEPKITPFEAFERSIWNTMLYNLSAPVSMPQQAVNLARTEVLERNYPIYELVREIAVESQTAEKPKSIPYTEDALRKGLPSIKKEDISQYPVKPIEEDLTPKTIPEKISEEGEKELAPIPYPISEPPITPKEAFPAVREEKTYSVASAMGMLITGASAGLIVSKAIAGETAVRLEHQQVAQPLTLEGTKSITLKRTPEDILKKEPILKVQPDTEQKGLEFPRIEPDRFEHEGKVLGKEETLESRPPVYKQPEGLKRPAFEQTPMSSNLTAITMLGIAGVGIGTVLSQTLTGRQVPISQATLPALPVIAKETTKAEGKLTLAPIKEDVIPERKTISVLEKEVEKSRLPSITGYESERTKLSPIAEERARAPEISRLSIEGDVKAKPVLISEPMKEGPRVARITTTEPYLLPTLSAIGMLARGYTYYPPIYAPYAPSAPSVQALPMIVTPESTISATKMPALEAIELEKRTETPKLQVQTVPAVTPTIPPLGILTATKTSELAMLQPLFTKPIPIETKAMMPLTVPVIPPTGELRRLGPLVEEPKEARREVLPPVEPDLLTQSLRVLREIKDQELEKTLVEKIEAKKPEGGVEIDRRLLYKLIKEILESEAKRYGMVLK